MSKEDLIKLADELDKEGLVEEAAMVDEILEKEAQLIPKLKQPFQQPENRQPGLGTPQLQLDPQIQALMNQPNKMQIEKDGVKIMSVQPASPTARKSAFQEVVATLKQTKDQYTKFGLVSDKSYSIEAEMPISSKEVGVVFKFKWA